LESPLHRFLSDLWWSTVFSILKMKLMGANDMKRVVIAVSLALVFGLAVGLLGLGATPAYAQVSKGSISGSVTDPQGAVVVGASVSAVSKDTNQSTTTESDSSGLFRISLLPPGTYRVEVAKQGFRKIVFDNVDVSVGADRGLGAVKLEVGEVSATVEVSSAAPLIQSTEAQVTNSFTSANLQTFAGVLENQGLDNLALTVPGVVNNRDLGFSNTNGTGFAVNGLRGRNNDQQLDGQNNNDNSVAGPGLFVSDVEFVQEYQITTNNFGAEYGRNSGSVVNIITKSGTNNVHGAVFGTESNSVLNALSNVQKQSVADGFEGLTKPARFNDEFTGGTVGGPLWKDHVFFFGGFDNEIVSQQQVYATGNLTPTAAGVAALAGCYNNTTSIQALQTYGPYAILGGSPTPLAAGPQYIINPPNPNSTDPRPTSPTFGQPACTWEGGGVQRTLATGSKSYNFPIKLDIQTAKNHFYGRYLYNRSTFYNTNAFGTAIAAAGYPSNVPALAQAYGFSWARTLSSHMSNEFRASYQRLNVEFGGNSIGNTIPNQNAVDTALASISFSNSSLVGFGPATNAPQGRIVNTYQLQDNWSYFRGRHSLKAGVNFTYQRSPNKFLPVLNGSWRFSSWASFAANTPNRVQIASGDPNLDFREKDTFVYFGDDFKIKNNLTLNLGITWSYYGQPANLFHDRSLAAAQSSTPLWNPTLPLSVTTFPAIPAPKNSWGPSIGFAWTPGGFGRLTGNAKTVLRGGYRLSYDPPFYNIYLNISSAAPNVLLNTLTGASATGNKLLANPTGPNVRTQLASSLLTGVFDPRTFNETSITPDFGPQRTHEWRLSVQRELGASAVFEAGYVGNRGQKLFQSVNGNPRIDGLIAAFPNLVPSGLTPCTTPTTVLGPGQTVHPELGRVSCDLGIVRRRTNTGYSDYHGLQTELRSTRLWNQLALKTSYTFSKTTDNASEIFSSFAGGGSQAFSQSQVNFTGEEHGISGLDFRHNWTLSFYEEIPVFRAQHGVIGHILGGWAISGTYFIASGQPYTPIQSALNCFSIPAAAGCVTSSAFNASSFYDLPFSSAFVGTLDQATRPFAGSPSAPVTAVGIFAGDACNNFGVGCSLGTTTLLSMNAINATGAETVVTNNDVRFIVNGFVANQQFGTPFGNVARNSVRDARTNIGSFAVFKTVNVKENFKVVWHMSMQNVFNHPNYFSIDPFVDDAGLHSEATGFGDPSVFSGGLQSGGAVGNPGRKIAFGLTLRW
jgi:carboxypeptidase family protein